MLVIGPGIDSFPSWMVAVLIAATSVWLISEYNMRYAWMAAVLMLLSVAVARPGAMGEIVTLIQTIFGTKPTTVSGGVPGRIQ